MQESTISTGIRHDVLTTETYMLLQMQLVKTETLKLVPHQQQAQSRHLICKHCR